MHARSEPPCPYVGRGGLKLAHALQEFAVDVTEARCADLGANLGGFTDCLLKHGAAEVVAVDTAYGVLDYRLRTDPRVTVMERSNALHVSPPEQRCDLVVMDMGWTPQRYCVPAALAWLASEGAIITLVKPHYERSHREGRKAAAQGVLDDAAARRELDRFVESAPELGVSVIATTTSPIKGGGKRGRGGNIEFLALLRPD